jgi:hypothetical protein
LTYAAESGIFEVNNDNLTFLFLHNIGAAESHSIIGRVWQVNGERETPGSPA